MTWTDAELDRAQYHGDVVADNAVQKMIGKWQHNPAFIQQKIPLFMEAMRFLKSLETNQDIDRIASSQAGSDDANAVIKEFVTNAGQLPDWANLNDVKRIEQLFAESGVLVSVLFFCVSLPEVYLIPDISTVLHSTGGLATGTELRIRSTAIMVLTVLLQGGLHEGAGGGRPQIIRARFIHALLRNLLTRGQIPRPYNLSLEEAVILHIPPLEHAESAKNMFEATYYHGWDLTIHGVPCNQEELAYTLLTFSYVYLRSLRRLGLAYSKQDEESYLHFWNIIGHLMGIEPDYMAHTMDGAKALFTQIQQKGLEIKMSNDPRKQLGQALISAIEKSIPYDFLKPCAGLIIKYLTSEQTTEVLGLNQGISVLARSIFMVLIVGVRITDASVRIFKRDFSLSRFIIRVVGYHLLSKVLTDPSQPIELPLHLRQRVNASLDEWSYDFKAPKWLNALEGVLTTKGSWKHLINL